MMMEAFSRNVSKLFSELKLVTDNLFLTSTSAVSIHVQNSGGVFVRASAMRALPALN